MSARPDLRLLPPRWPFGADVLSLTIDFSQDVPGVGEYANITETDGRTGEIQRISAKPSAVIPGGISLTYPSHDMLYAHLQVMGMYRQLRDERLAAFDRPVEPASEPTQPARLVFGRMSQTDGRKLAKRAAANGNLQESLL